MISSFRFEHLDVVSQFLISIHSLCFLYFAFVVLISFSVSALCSRCFAFFFAVSTCGLEHLDVSVGISAFRFRQWLVLCCEIFRIRSRLDAHLMLLCSCAVLFLCRIVCFVVQSLAFRLAQMHVSCYLTSEYRADFHFLMLLSHPISSEITPLFTQILCSAALLLDASPSFMHGCTANCFLIIMHHAY